MRELSQHLPTPKRSSIEQLMSFDRVKSRSIEIDEREDFGVPIIPKLSVSFNQDYPFRDIAADSRDPEEEKETRVRYDNDLRTAAAKRSSSQDIFISHASRAMSVTRDQAAGANTDNNAGSFWASSNSLKRANPIYESDNEYEETDEPLSNSMHSMRKRRCSIDRQRVTTAVYWQQELTSSDE